MTVTMSIPTRVKDKTKKDFERARIERAIIMKIQVIAHDLEIQHDPDQHEYALDLEDDWGDDPKCFELYTSGIVGILNEDGQAELRKFLLDLYLRTGTLVVL